MRPDWFEFSFVNWFRKNHLVIGQQQLDECRRILASPIWSRSSQHSYQSTPSLLNTLRCYRGVAVSQACIVSRRTEWSMRRRNCLQSTGTSSSASSLMYRWSKATQAWRSKWGQSLRQYRVVEATSTHTWAILNQLRRLTCNSTPSPRMCGEKTY